MEDKIEQAISGEISGNSDTDVDTKKEKEISSNHEVLTTGELSQMDSDSYNGDPYDPLHDSPSHDPPTPVQLGRSSSLLGLIQPSDSDTADVWDHLWDGIEDIFDGFFDGFKKGKKLRLPNPFTVFIKGILTPVPAGEPEGFNDGLTDRGNGNEPENNGNRPNDRKYSKLRPGDPDFSYHIENETYKNGDIKKIAITSDGRRIPLYNSKHAGKTHNGVPYDENGFPDFEQWVVAEVQLPNDKIVGSHGTQLSLSTDLLKEKYPDWEKRFNLPPSTKDDLKSGKGSPEGYTWHHHQDTGRMQLIPRDVHQRARHTGGHAIWGKQKVDQDDHKKKRKSKKKNK
ncbi:HNH endonuclease [Melghirimyces algeriensis]|uniref:DNase/tRNase domain of colicin-like bacteriocin n=1 Tax=Melghirimyces algeriensis TaxID=910412 RepID=A0A521FHP5_9BACL|nr:HNH endonuclease [Melghirimyces algeriensis]SMO95181.1 DNase/tRNase domain of colicin-like bacteriocin [Melghirimyces algeriensis]